MHNIIVLMTKTASHSIYPTSPKTSLLFRFADKIFVFKIKNKYIS